MRRNCRVWWPSHLSSTQPQSSSFLFGWFVSSSPASLEIIVAFACNEASFSSIRSDLEGIFHKTNGKMPGFLQDRCMLSTLGYCSADSISNGQLPRDVTEQNDQINYPDGNSSPWTHQDMLKDEYGQWVCGCHRVDGLLEQCRPNSKKSNSIQLVYGSYAYSGRKFGWIPRLHHIHWDGQAVSDIDLHIVIYETPIYGGHHFSLGFWSSSDQVKPPLRKPKWVENLHQKQPLLDLDTVILAINCATAATSFFEELVCPDRSTFWSHIACMFVTLTWKLLAMSVASLSTFLYIILQFLHLLISYGTKSCIYNASANLFGHTWRNIRVRCCQILYWPIFLPNNGFRSESCVEYVEKSSLRRHSIWSSAAVDVLLGNLFGIALLIHADSACLWISTFANDITNHWLLISCARLMGNPAGFKLNTELAGVLGTISLNAIQIWSTLWGSVCFLFIYFIKGLAISGVIFGLTTPAALTIDMITISTIHVASLHWLISLLYSQQIQAIAALWRLFRGQKWNPLRQRLDSYDYTVEQHILGSLLFTPLLLLLPTTSAFYMFFTIMNMTISFICMLIEVAISIIHATPYTKIFLWLVRPGRFPCGIWFEISSFENHAIEMLQERIDTNASRSGVLVSCLHGYSLNIRQLVWPHYRYLGSAVSRSSVASLVYGIFSGRSLPSPLYSIPPDPGAVLPSKMSWMFIPYKEYWLICHDAIFACKPDYRRPMS